MKYLNGIIDSINRAAPINPDAQAFFNRVTAAGGTLTNTEKTAVNQLVLNLKANSLWNLMKAIYPMVGASAAACAQNLISNLYAGTFSGGWTYASTGITSNGTNAYLSTNFINQSDFSSLSNGSMGLISTTNQSAAVCDMGSGLTIADGSNSTTIYTNYTGTYYAGFNCLSVSGSANTSSIGFFVTTRLTTTEYNLYKRGTSTINLTTTNVIGANPNGYLFLGAGNNLGTAQAFAAKQYNYCFMGDGLTQSQVDTYYSILQTFNTALSR